MTKDELMQMAREAGIEFFVPTDGYCLTVGIPVGSITTDGGVLVGPMQMLANAILERAAVECDELSKCMQQDDHMEGCIDSAYQVRALKIKEGE